MTVTECRIAELVQTYTCCNDQMHFKKLLAVFSILLCVYFVIEKKAHIYIFI